MQYRLKIWFCFLVTAFFTLMGSAYGRSSDVGLRMIKIMNGNGTSICATAQAALSPDGRMSFDAKTATLVVVDRPDYLPHIEELVRTLDVRVPQVGLSVRIAEVNGRFLKKTGIRYGQIIFPRGSFDPVSGLLSTRTDSSVRSNTMLKTMSGVPTQLRVNREEIFGIVPVTDGSGHTVTLSRKKDTGESLEVLPTANLDNTVTVTVRPSRSRVDGDGAVSETAVLAQVTLRSGDTCVIGSVDAQDLLPEAENKRKSLIFLTASVIY